MLLLLADSLMSILSDRAVVFWLVGGTVAIILIIAMTISSISQTRQREQTRREIAAYLAEGSIDKDTALAMLKEINESGEEEEEA